ncbi:MAG TPA: hypothetical protein VGM94_05855 [Galbitalea sp.]
MSSTTPAQPREPRVSPRARGLGRVLVTVYAILAIGATSRAIYQIFTIYHSAPVPITLSAVSGVIYILATIALILPGASWYRVAWITISFELAGVLIVGTLSVLAPAIFAGGAEVSFGTVWSYYGIGYLLIPLALPVLGMLWLRRTRPVAAQS